MRSRVWVEAFPSLSAEAPLRDHRLQERAGLVFRVPELLLVPVVETVAHLRGIVRKLKRECGRIPKGEPVWEFIRATSGLSDAACVFLGACPPLTGFAGPRSFPSHIPYAWRFL